MISRTWHGMVPLKMRDGFKKYEYETGIKDTLALAGNCGAFLKLLNKATMLIFSYVQNGIRWQV